MKKWIVILMTLMLGLSTACAEESEDAFVPTDSNILVACFSATGNTWPLAEYAAEYLNADLFRIEPQIPYTDADLDWTDENSRVVSEYENPEQRDIELAATEVPGWEDYDTVFIGYPIWWGIAAWPVNDFVESNDFTGKTVIPFCTSSSSGMGESSELLEEMAGTGTWLEGMRFRGSASESEVAEWIAELNL